MQPDFGTDNNKTRRVRIRVFIFFTVLFLGLGVYLIIVNRPSRPQQADQNHAASFSGLSSFVDSGLTNDQVNNLIKAFSKYAPSAKTVTVDTNSLVPDPHDPGSPVFTIRFKATVDSTPYQGLVKYSGLEMARLILYADNGKQVFDSN